MVCARVYVMAGTLRSEDTFQMLAPSIMWVLGLELRPLGLAAGTFTQWARPPASHEKSELIKKLCLFLLLCKVMSFTPSFSCVCLLCFSSFLFSNALPGVPGPGSMASLVSFQHLVVTVLGSTRSSCLCA